MTQVRDEHRDDEQRIDFIVPLSSAFKAVVAQSGGDGERIVFCEASNSSKDLQDERILVEALKGSADYFLEKGNIDIAHLSKIGYRYGYENPRQYEIGRPIEVRFDGEHTYVKCRIYKGDPADGTMAKSAEMFWKSLTALDPPAPWWASVAGNVLDFEERDDVRLITKVRWNNLAFADEPVNHTVKGVTLYPLPVFAKSWGGECFGECELDTSLIFEVNRLLQKANGKRNPLRDLLSERAYELLETYFASELGKSLTAGSNVDPVEFEGGEALREEALTKKKKRKKNEDDEDKPIAAVTQRAQKAILVKALDHIVAEGFEATNKMVTQESLATTLIQGWGVDRPLAVSAAADYLSVLGATLRRQVA